MTDGVKSPSGLSLPTRVRAPNQGCQMAVARFLDHMCLALRASGLWPRYAALQNLIPSFPWIAPPTPSTLVQSKERKGSNFAIWQPWTPKDGRRAAVNRE